MSCVIRIYSVRKGHCFGLQGWKCSWRNDNFAFKGDLKQKTAGPTDESKQFILLKRY